MARVSMDDAVRLTLERNQTLRAQRLDIDGSKADEITAALKPNLEPRVDASEPSGVFTQPAHMVEPEEHAGSSAETSATCSSAAASGTIGSLVARGHDRCDGQDRADAERQLAFQAGRRSSRVLLSKSTLALAQDEPGELLEFRRHQPRSAERGGHRRRRTSSRSRSRSCSSSRTCRRRSSRSCKRRPRCGSSWATTP